jgi:replication initiation and membrane attachment protein DnaB
MEKDLDIVINADEEEIDDYNPFELSEDNKEIENDHLESDEEQGFKAINQPVEPLITNKQITQNILNKLNQKNEVEEDDLAIRDLVVAFDSWESEDFLVKNMKGRDELLQRDFELIDTLRDEYELTDGVINVLIYYTISETERLPKPYVLKVAQSWSNNDITTTRLAVKHIVRTEKNKIRFMHTMRETSIKCSDVIELLNKLEEQMESNLEEIRIINKCLNIIQGDLEEGAEYQ